MRLGIAWSLLLVPVIKDQVGRANNISFSGYSINARKYSSCQDQDFIRWKCSLTMTCGSLRKSLQRQTWATLMTRSTSRARSSSRPTPGLLVTSGRCQMTGERIYHLSISIFLFFRFLINEPAWLDSWCYCLFECLCLGPAYRLLFWLTVKTVNVHIVKTFNTEGRHQEPNQQYSERGTNPYSNNLEGFVIKKFTPGNSAGDEQVSLRAGLDAV